MYNIAIVEDNDNDAKLLQSFIINISEKEHTEYNVVRFHDATSFLKDYKPIYAVVLLDVEMPNMNGVEASGELRKIDKSCSIIFVTNLIQYAQKGYEVDAVAYLIKPVQYFDFSLKFKKAISLYSLNEDKDYLVKAGKGIYHISTNKLMFVEVIRHRLYYHLVDEVIEVTGTISKAEEELKDYGFLKCNQCYLVNPNYISKIEGLELTVGSSVLLISRPRKKIFLEELANWYSGVK
ncbi:MAG: response regulator transcription factor [Erysipelotrichaceae bacterium]|nr:response regulator transcription factor [Erysipelotrichaceae bacterium]